MSRKKLRKVIEKMVNRTKEETSEEKSLSIPTTVVTYNPFPKSSETTTSGLTMMLPKKIYIKSISLRGLEELEKVKKEVKSGNIVIVGMDHVPEKNIDSIKSAINDLYEFTEKIGGDIARLGEKYVIVTPISVRIWKEQGNNSERKD